MSVLQKITQQLVHICLFTHAINGGRMSASDVFTHVGDSPESFSTRWDVGGASIQLEQGWAII